MKEIQMLSTDPGPGICAWAEEDNNMLLHAQIQGPNDSPYVDGLFQLTITVPDKYPFEPPAVRFVTPIYHPNIDSDGRICLDTLKMQPHGSWSPSINLNTLLLTIRVLMGSPNPDDGLVPDITEEYKRDRELWKRKASEHTKLHATTNKFVDVKNISTKAVLVSSQSLSKNSNSKVDNDNSDEDNVSDNSSDYSESEEESTRNIGGNLGVTATKRVNDNTNDDTSTKKIKK
jgi:ubiquitin-conjugating enzyme E2 T